MRVFLPFFLLLLGTLTGSTQTITVSGACITGTSTLTKVADENGKVAYAGTGTVAGFPDIDISIYWMGEPDNLWVLAYDGQPYYSSDCDRSTPPSTTNPNCTWTAVEAACSNPAALVIAGAGTLPVRLGSFTATKVGNKVQLAWSTSAETNNKGFDVQRSADGNTWTSLGFVNGAGQSAQARSYRFDDAAPRNGKNYYRLQQVDFDGRSSTSSIVTVDIAANGFYTLQPAGNGQYRLQIHSSQTVALQVVDMSGKKLLSKTVAQGIHPIDMSAYAQGIYLLQLTKDNVVTTEKLIKQ
ncbi:T9SS type A sorting domain-containing protein [Flavisolibacter sp. BT320]|nr:T9SS type A sorting domain-containing protein [Flavisolibacter longurius]